MEILSTKVFMVWHTVATTLKFLILFFTFVGVAFEQGRTLPIPETVPFRLTRDLVDGMGVAGVEGVFRKCCEETLQVMRHSQEELKTIVEVFKLIFNTVFTL